MEVVIVLGVVMVLVTVIYQQLGALNRTLKQVETRQESLELDCLHRLAEP